MYYQHYKFLGITDAMGFNITPRKKPFPNNIFCCYILDVIAKVLLATIQMLLHVVAINVDAKSFATKKYIDAKNRLNATKNIVALHSYSCGL